MKIKHPLVKGEIKEIKPFIYAAKIPDAYERGMLFCRYQEFYESPIKSIRGKYFTLEELMHTYTKTNKHNSFIYPDDWAGYNIPSHILDKSVNLFYKENEYDKIMNNIYFHCSIDSQNKNNGTRTKWYLISAEDFDSKLMDHEIAHGLYYTNSEYKKKCTDLINEMRKVDYESMRKKLIKMGYGDDKNIIDDEIQAYLSTGLYPQMNTESLKNARKPFLKNFKKFKNV